MTPLSRGLASCWSGVAPVRTETPNRHIARELALCIAPDIDVSSLAPSILEILTAADLAEAMTVLDEYGVRDLDHSDWKHVASQTSDDVELGDVIAAPLTDTGPDDMDSQGSPPTAVDVSLHDDEHEVRPDVGEDAAAGT